MNGWRIARDEFERLGETLPLYEWKIIINRRLKVVAGQANYKTKTIEVAPWLLESGEEGHILDTVRHEAAHAIAGARAGHGPDWKTACKLTGAKPERTYDKKLSAHNEKREFRYEVYCQRCHKVVGQRRNRPKRGRTYTHTGCGGTVVWQSLQERRSA